MSTPLSTPVKAAKLRLAGGRSQPLASEFKRLLGEQQQRLAAKHQQDLELIEEVRSYAKARLSIERQYTSSLSKLARQHAAQVAKRFQLLPAAGAPETPVRKDAAAGNQQQQQREESGAQQLNESDASDSRLQRRLAREHQQAGGADQEPEEASSLYQVWAEHASRLEASAQNRSQQFEQLGMLVDKLKEVRSRKASIGKKCLEGHLKKVHEELLASVVELERARRLYHEDESQALKARQHEEKVRRKRSGLISKFTGQNLEAKKERTSARREANDIQSTQARNDYIMALAAANAHLDHYFRRDLPDFMLLIDDGSLDHCKISLATLSECDLNSLRECLASAKYWSKMINLTGSQTTNALFLESQLSRCLREPVSLSFEACNEDPIRCISLEHNADYALQHEIDKWLTWFKKECRNLGQLMHSLELCQRALGDGRRSVELAGGQVVEDLEGRMLELRQLIRKSEAAKQKAQARLRVIKEGGMQIEEWAAIEAEIEAGQREAARRQAPQVNLEAPGAPDANLGPSNEQDSDDAQGPNGGQQADGYDSISHNLASISRSPSNQPTLQQVSSYAALADPAAAWQEDAWAQPAAPPTTGAANYSLTVVTPAADQATTSGHLSSTVDERQHALAGNPRQPELLAETSMTVQSSSPLSAQVDPNPPSTSPYPLLAGDAYKSDFECDYNRNQGGLSRSAMSSAADDGPLEDHYKRPVNAWGGASEPTSLEPTQQLPNQQLLNRHVLALYDFDQTNHDELAFRENELLLVLEVSDENWFRARSLATGQEGYVPAPYVRLVESEEALEPPPEQVPPPEEPAQEAAWNSRDTPEEQLEPDAGVEEQQPLLCRALYDYQPERSFDELDGLPHLVLRRAEVLRVLDQQSEDGWWLVERLESGERGHAPSMLLEELEAGEPNLDDEDEDDDDGEPSVRSLVDDQRQPEEGCGAPPSFEPPQLSEEPPEEEEELQGPPSVPAADYPPSQANSLAATSFIIIEPTPEVEWKKSVDGEEAAAAAQQSPQADQRETVVARTVPPASTSYSIVNEDFILEKPIRRPSHHHSEQIPHHETPTIPEEEDAEDQEAPVAAAAPALEPEVAPQPTHAHTDPETGPPCVIIDTCEDKARLDADDDDDDDDEDLEGGKHAQHPDNEDTFSLGDDSQDSREPSGYSSSPAPDHNTTQQQPRANVDVSPILRYRAEQFSKQIIEEALDSIHESSPADRQLL